MKETLPLPLPPVALGRGVYHNRRKRTETENLVFGKFWAGKHSYCFVRLISLPYLLPRALIAYMLNLLFCIYLLCVCVCGGGTEVLMSGCMHAMVHLRSEDNCG